MATVDVVAAATIVVAEAVLFDRFGSVWSPSTVAWLTIVPGAVGVTWIVTVALAPLASEPRLQVTVPNACEQLPCDAVAEPNVTPAGSVSVTTTPVAGALPVALATFSV